MANARITSAEVDQAFKAFAAVQKAGRDDPSLLRNAYFMALHDTAFARFQLAFDAMDVR